MRCTLAGGRFIGFIRSDLKEEAYEGVALLELACGTSRSWGSRQHLLALATAAALPLHADLGARRGPPCPVPRRGESGGR